VASSVPVPGVALSMRVARRGQQVLGAVFGLGKSAHFVYDLGSACFSGNYGTASGRSSVQSFLATAGVGMTLQSTVASWTEP